MQTAARKSVDGKTKLKEKVSKDDTNPLLTKTQEEKLKKTAYSVSTPRNYVQKSSTADIYVQKKKTAPSSAITPKKVPGTTNKNSVSPMKDFLKSSPSSVSQLSNKKVKNSSLIKNEAKVPISARNATPRTAKDLPFVNVTVNSPAAKKKLNLGKDSVNNAHSQSKEYRTKSDNLKEVGKKRTVVGTKEVNERQRTKTRTLNENEVKVLTPDAVDNNAEMLNLARKLTAKPKAFYVELDEPKETAKSDKPSEDEYSYEDDFESYESDFDSYHESQSEHSSTNGHDVEGNSIEGNSSEENEEDSSNQNIEQNAEGNGRSENNNGNEGAATKEAKDEEKMLDSGNFDLREPRSATKAKPAMQFILEDGEADTRSSLTDEGFQEMNSSAVSSIRIMHTELLDRPLFIDFTKSKENKRKRKLFEKLKQRAHDILSMVTLHEMSYSLFEMKPIPYDVYMATFGRSNYTQTAVQTFDDGITEEVQTDDIETDEKWTQHPIEFSKHDIYLKTRKTSRKYSRHTEDYLTKFTFLVNKSTDVDIENKINLDEDYKSNPLRMYFEQKDGVGSSAMMPFESYKAKLRKTEFSTVRLSKFLKRAECRISHILSINKGSSDNTELVKASRYNFSKGFMPISMKNIADDKLSFLKHAKVSGVLFSQSKSNLILTVHKQCPNLVHKCIVCLWDVSVASRDPIKLLIVIDEISIGRFKGSRDGIFVAVLVDGSIHLWDLSEEPTWHPDVANPKKAIDIVQVNTESMTPSEMDREWNLQNSHVGYETWYYYVGVRLDVSIPLPVIQPPSSNARIAVFRFVGQRMPGKLQAIPQCLLRACAYTTSAASMQNRDFVDSTVGLEVHTKTATTQDGGRRVLGQVCTLQRIGILTIWSIIQEKIKTSNADMGKAYWSKMKLEKNQTISLVEHLGIARAESLENIFISHFNLNAAKTRMSFRKKEKTLKKQLSRQKSAVSDRPTSAANVNKKVLPDSNWENGIVCTDLKIMRLDNNDNYLVAKNCGEVLCCTKNAGVVKISRFCVATDTSSVTSLDVSPHSLPYFLAATDAGTINLCSILESRVLLTLDCRNGPPAPDAEKYHVDHKGRYLGSASGRVGTPTIRPATGIAVKTVLWSHVDPCTIFASLEAGAVLCWELTYSDIHAKCVVEKAAKEMTHHDNALALLTADGEVQIHRLCNERHTKVYLDLFQKYVALL